jgi:hypothetical protein
MPQAKAVAETLGRGRAVPDFRFDAIYPPEIRRHSRIHFTPVAVALKVREWLGPEPSLRLLDVGSGCGKFCLVFGASGLGRVTGIEQRPHLHAAAENAAQAMGLANVSFVCGRMEDLDWRPFNVFYFFNPFYEAIARKRAMDDRISMNAGLFFDNLRQVRKKLEDVRPGSRVVTYHGLGGRLSSNWLLLRSEPIHTDELCLWIKS